MLAFALIVLLPLGLISAFAAYLAYCYSTKRWPERFTDERPFVGGFLIFNLCGGGAAAILHYLYPTSWWLFGIWFIAPFIAVGALWGGYIGIRSLLQFFHNLGERNRDEQEVA